MSDSSLEGVIRAAIEAGVELGDIKMAQEWEEAAARAYINKATQTALLQKEKVLLQKEKVLLEETVEMQSNQLKRQELTSKCCIEMTYGKTANDPKSKFRQPKLDPNSLGKPSVKGNTRVVDHRIGGKSKKVAVKIPKANKIMLVGTAHWLKVGEVTIPVQDKEGRDIPSVLGPMAGAKQMTISNEYSVQELCKQMIVDALSCLGLSEEVKAHLEISLYMMKPDIVLVLKFRGRIFFCVQVKSPAKQEDVEKLYKNMYLGGQIWSYLHAMKASGVENPIGAIMTYDTIAIVTLDDLSKIDSHKKALQETKQHLSTGVTPELKGQDANEGKCSERTNSPGKKSLKVAEHNKEYNDGLKKKFTDENEIPMARKVCYSSVQKDGNVFPFLIQAILTAYKGVEYLDNQQLPVVSAEDDIGRRLVFKLGKDSFDWVLTPKVHRKGKQRMPLRAKVDNCIPPSNATYFYVLGKLGDGGKASVYLACSTGGHVCAIKDLFLRPSHAAYPEEREAEEEAERERIHGLVEEEEARWEALYSERGGKSEFKARAQCLGGKTCLLMPYGCAITAEEDRWKHIPAVRDELDGFAAKGYVYEESDLRFRHVLLDTKGKIFLCDLESLTQGEINDNEEAVYKQLRVLLKPMVDEEQHKDTLGWLENDVDAAVSLINANQTLLDFVQPLASDSVADFVCSLPSMKGSKKSVALSMICHFRGLIKDEPSRKRRIPSSTTIPSKLSKHN